MKPGDMLRQYRLVEPAGEGGMGVVWKAEDTVLGRTVAIKVLPQDVSRDEQRRRMFLDEARLASSLSEAHIAQVHEFGREGDRDFIVMEYVEGRPLTKLIMGRPLPPEKVADWGHQVAHALSRAHRKGLLHRDIKPANILVTGEGDVKLVDFGVATLFGRSGRVAADAADATSVETVTTLRGTGSRDRIAGTLPYMSPEQVRGEELGVHSDIFSLGVVIYEMTTGQRPFRAKTPDDLAAAISLARARPVHDLVPQVPLDLDRIVHKALSPKPSDRYQTMEDMAVDLRKLGRDLESGSSPAYTDLKQPAAPAKKVSGWKIAALAAGAVAMVAAALAGGRMLTGGGGAGPAAPPVDRRAILVMPLEVRGQSDGADYVGKAFAEAVAVALAQAKDLKVLPVPEVEKSGASPAIDRIGMARKLGAGLVLTGAITRDGEVIQASMTVVDTTENRIVWGVQKQAREGDLAGLASVMAREGVQGISPQTVRQYASPFEITGGPEMSASSLTADAIGALRRSEDAAALDATGKLVAAFPGDEAAWVLRGQALANEWQATGGDESVAAIMEGVIRTIRSMDPSGPYPDVFTAQMGREPAPALEVIARVLAREDLSPSLRYDALRYRAWLQRNTGDIQAAVADMEKAVMLYPASATALSELGYLLREAGRAEEGLVRARQAVSLEPQSWFMHHSLAHVLSGLKRWDEAAQAYGRACELSHMQQPCAGEAGALMQAGHREEALAKAADAERMPATLSGSYNLACFWAQAGDRAKALEFLRRAAEAGMRTTWLAEDPDLLPLHGDPEFEKIVDVVTKRAQGKVPISRLGRPPGQ